MLPRIMKEYEHDDRVSYRIGCGCYGGAEHDLSIYAGQDKDGTATIDFSAKLNTPYWGSTFESPWLSWLNEPIKRVKLAAKILVVGYSEYSFDFILDKDNVAALRYALDEIEKKWDQQ